MKQIRKTSLCPILIEEEDGYIVRLSFQRGVRDEKNDRGASPLLDEAFEQLERYFKGQIKEFDLPIKLKGTDFQKRVWRQLQKIPYGKTRSYGQTAAAVKNPKGARAVGMANNKNPIPIIVPCHRVIGADGALIGFAGRLDLKKKLLKLEGALS